MCSSLLAVATLLLGCASGPHPALKLAAKHFACEESALKLHEIYPKKVRIEGCGKDAIYVDACGGYGVQEKCAWARAAPEF
jgi:hypothetical protein